MDGGAMAQSPADARQEVANARLGVEQELDNLASAGRAAVDIPAKIRRNPAKTAGLAGGAAFLLLGGPRRVARSAERRFFPRRASRVPSVLPADIEETINRLEPDQRDLVRGHLESDFNSYLRREHAEEPANARRSVWKTYDLLLASVGSAAAREMVKRLFQVPPDVQLKQTADQTAESITRAADNAAAAGTEAIDKATKGR